MEELTNAIVLIVAFLVTVGIFRGVAGLRARRAMKREQYRAEQERVRKSLQPPSKNKSKRRREQRLM
jgi:steroid 5-alpha reductase family enzyme